VYSNIYVCRKVRTIYILEATYTDLGVGPSPSVGVGPARSTFFPLPLPPLAIFPMYPRGDFKRYYVPKAQTTGQQPDLKPKGHASKLETFQLVHYACMYSLAQIRITLVIVLLIHSALCYNNRSSITLTTHQYTNKVVIIENTHTNDDDDDSSSSSSSSRRK
jgi:hypothetical protein